MNKLSLAVGAVLALGIYYLGASGLIPETTHRLRVRARRTIARWVLKPAWHPARWAYETVVHALSARGIALAFVFHPRKATACLRQILPLFPWRQPAELKEAVAEAARLHIPGKPVVAARFAFRDGRCDLTNVTFRHGRAPDDVTRITLGGNPDHYGGLTPGQGTRTELDASRERVDTALRALPIGPYIRALTVRAVRHEDDHRSTTPGGRPHDRHAPPVGDQPPVLLP
ncbi:hypothetical protein AB0M58_13705 [Streptomyces bobili]|uniref:hypothetical protein n=1 Tax=Streptomyces bobili TaxID=67280 RepID=UPI00341D0608